MRFSPEDLGRGFGLAAGGRYAQILGGVGGAREVLGRGFGREVLGARFWARGFGFSTQILGGVGGAGGVLLVLQGRVIGSLNQQCSNSESQREAARF